MKAIYGIFVGSILAQNCGSGRGSCAAGQCCSQWNWCGTSTAHCVSGCQSRFGTCQGIAPPPVVAPVPVPPPVSAPVAPPANTVFSTSRCGPDGNNMVCAAGLACSQWGWCGNTNEHRGTRCQPSFSSASLPCLGSGGSVPPVAPVPAPVPAPSVAPAPAPVPSQPPALFTPRAFNGPQRGIGSWFRANSASDFTNGNSWCGYPYKDYTPGFAPDLSQMTQGTLAVWGHPRWAEFGREYCGLEAIVRNPTTGIESTLYITDAFDPRWVRSPGSIDIHVQSYQVLTRFATLDKNIVIQNVEWRLTGRRNARYAFQGQGDR